jgi:integral membrane protein (TIGR01906 family)
MICGPRAGGTRPGPSRTSRPRLEVKPGIARTILGSLAGLATMITIVAVAILVFLNPIYVSFGQGRAGVTELTGYDQATVEGVTNSILHDLIFGPPEFAVQVDGAPVLGERERAHMADVRNVFFAFGALALLAVLVLVNLAIAARRQAWFRRAVRRGAILLAILVVVLGVLAAVAFDTVFETFHELFFPPGSFDFEASSKLIQLFPDQFWFETSLLLAVVILGLCGLVAALSTGGQADPAFTATSEAAA